MATLSTSPAAAPGPSSGRVVSVLSGRSTYWLSATLAGVTLLAAGLSFHVSGILAGPAVARGSMRGTALVLMYVAVPMMGAGMAWTARSSARGLVVWLGSVAFVLYQSVLFLGGIRFNALFLLYVTMLSLSLWTFVTLVRRTDTEAFRRRFDGGFPARVIAAYSLATVGLTAINWLRTVVPASFADDPDSFLEGSGMTTNPVIVQDLAFWLPLLGVSAVGMWRRRGGGYLLVGAVLAMLVVEAVSVAVDQWFGAMADPNSPHASVSMVVPMLVLAIVGAVPLALYLRHLDRS